MVHMHWKGKVDTLGSGQRLMTAMDSIMKLKISQITVILRWQWLIFWQHNPQQNHDEMIVDDPEKMLMNSL